jgi:hypothetical protein
MIGGISYRWVCSQLGTRHAAARRAGSETCPIWPGRPVSAHWGIADPAEATGTPAEIALAFKEACRMLFQRIGIFTALPLRSRFRPSVRYVRGLRQFKRSGRFRL